MPGYGRSSKLLPVPNARSTPSLRILVVGAGVGGISVARGLLRDGHDVTVFEQRPNSAGRWRGRHHLVQRRDGSGAAGVDMDGAGQRLSTVRVVTSTGRPLVTLDLTAIVDRLGAPVRMVPRRVLLERLLEGFPTDRIRYDSRAVGVVTAQDGVRVEFEDGSCSRGGSVDRCGWYALDGSRHRRRATGGADRLVQLAGTGHPSGRPRQARRPADHRRARKPRPVAGRWLRCAVVVRLAVVVGLRQTGTSDRRDQVQFHRMVRRGRSSTRNVDRRRSGPFAVSAFSASDSPVPRQGALTLLGDAAHTMPPTLAQGTNQALLDTMVLCKALSDFRKTNGSNGDLSSALRWYEKTRRRRVTAVSRVASLQVSHGESVLKPAAMIPDRFMTWALTMFLASVSHRRISAEVNRDLAAATTSPGLTVMPSP